jgi:hypothetical protein
MRRECEDYLCDRWENADLPVCKFVIISVDSVIELDYFKAYFRQIVKCWIIELGFAGCILLIS